MGVKHNGQVRLFMSVDLVGSTAFKGTHSERPADDVGTEAAGPPSAKRVGRPVGPAWANVFQDFYRFHHYFARPYNKATLDATLHPRVVKAIGDELLMVVEINSRHDALKVVRCFANAMPEYWKLNLKKHRLHLKGAAWMAGFPNTNHRVSLDAANGAQEDFIGPSIDAGFRVSKFATPSKLMLTVDLALLLTQDKQCQLYCDGFESMKGVLDGRPYPLFWHPVITEDERLDELARKITGMNDPKPADVRDYCKEFIGAAKQWLCLPYFQEADDDVFNVVPPEHEEQYKLDAERDERNEDDGDEPSPTQTKASAAPFELPSDIPFDLPERSRPYMTSKRTAKQRTQAMKNKATKRREARMGKRTKRK